MRLFTSRSGFILFYLVLMIPTYLLPYGGSNSFLGQSAAATQNTAAAADVQQLFLFHVGALLVLCLLAAIRGRATHTQWIVILPMLAGIFDMVPGLSLIPLVPTFFHVLTLIFGARGTPTVAVVSETTST